MLLWFSAKMSKAVSMLLVFTLSWLGNCDAHAENAPIELTISERAKIRDCIYHKPPATETRYVRNRPFVRLVIPDAIGTAYNKSPSEVLRLLLDIIEGANPDNANLAFCYAISLTGYPEGGAHFVWADVSKYDELIKDREITLRGLQKHVVMELVESITEREAGGADPEAKNR